jgi:hypothetical protein
LLRSSWTRFAAGCARSWHDVLDLGLADRLLLLRLRQDALRRTGFVDHVDRLVRQMTVVMKRADSSAAAVSAEART